MPDIDVRTAEEGDRAAIRDLVRNAFAKTDTRGDDEVRVVDDSWDRGIVIEDLELVALARGDVIAHVMTAWGDLGGRPAAAVAPLAVAPAWQGRRIGTVLMVELLTRAEEHELPLVALLGDPGYYRRFGFEPAHPLGIAYPPVGADSPYFLVRRLTAYDPSYQGDFVYGWEGSAEDP